MKRLFILASVLSMIWLGGLAVSPFMLMTTADPPRNLDPPPGVDLGGGWIRDPWGQWHSQTEEPPLADKP